MDIYDKKLFFGLDLGQAVDFTALSIIERLRPVHPRTFETVYGEDKFNCVHLQRWALRTSYAAIVSDVVKMINGLGIEQTKHHSPDLAIDATGVGAPVVDLFKKETINASLSPIQIVGGAQVSKDNGVTRVPKRDLVSVVQVALQNRTLKVAASLPEANTLVRELENFQVKITDAANDVYGAWRTGTHDDLVLATALALWSAANKKTSGISQIEFYV
jgi:hypothetical protein